VKIGMDINRRKEKAKGEKREKGKELTYKV